MDVARVVGISTAKEVVGAMAGEDVVGTTVGVVVVGSAVVPGVEDASVFVLLDLGSWRITAPEVLVEASELGEAGRALVAGATVAGASVLAGVVAGVVEIKIGAPLMVVVPMESGAAVSEVPLSSVTVTISITTTISLSISRFCLCKYGAVKTSLASKEEANTITLEKVVSILFVDL